MARSAREKKLSIVIIIFNVIPAPSKYLKRMAVRRVVGPCWGGGLER
jgi:hypothetical protein